MRKKKRVEKKRLSVPECLVVGTAGGFAVWLILLFAFAACIAKSQTPEKLILPAVFVLAGVSSFTGGLLTRLFYPGKVLVSLLTGFLLLCVIELASVICTGGAAGPVSIPLKVLLAIEFPLFSLVGASLLRPRKRRRAF